MATNAGRKSERLSRENRSRHPARRIRHAISGRISQAWSEAPAEHRVLARELAEAVAGEVRFDIGSRALYSTDASNYRQVPIGVVVPETVEDAVAAVEICRRHDAAVLPRGGGTSLSGECCNVAVVIDFSKYLRRVIDLDAAARLARVEPGCVLDTLRDEGEKHQLTFGPDPSTHYQNTLGGMIGNNSGGVHAVMAGITVHNVQDLDVFTYDGVRMTVGPTTDQEFKAILAEGGRKAEIYRGLDALRQKYGDLIRKRYPDIPRRVSGYENLDQLLPEKGFNVARALVGTEGTCVTVLGATLNLVDSPKSRVIAVLGFPDVFDAADAVPRVLDYGPVGLEGMDRLLVANMRKKQLHVEHLDVLPEGDGWLIVEFGGDDENEATAKAKRIVEDFDGRDGIEAKMLRDPDQQARLWKVRESGLGATAYVPGDPDTWEGWEDTAVHRDNLGDYLRELRALFDKYDYASTFYGHFGDGLVHCRIDFDLRSPEGLETWRRFLDEAADLVVRYDGSLSGEHGDGQAKAALLEKMYGPELMEAFREFKAIWDPGWKMNPGKVIDPFPITSNLRIGPGYKPPDFDTHFDFADDKGMFAHATRRCVGVGKCRRPDPDGQVMCPSFQVTREEKHSTRGRARLLYEMVHGGAIESGWRSDAVEDALSLCLACKGCKSDCPVKVDMATYKAEFRAHHFNGRIRPRAAYSVGLIYWWSRLAGVMPWLANFATQTCGVEDAVKWAAGLSRERQMPRYAREPFTRWFQKRPKPVGGRPRVLLWPDTFNNYFRPETAIAATRVLEAAGYEVSIPPRPLCCGRPLYDWGMLDRAKKLWLQTLDALREDIEAGVPLIGLEPACVSAFRDELIHLLPGNELATSLSRQTLFFSEFLDREMDGVNLKQSEEKALVQIHCHHHAVIEPDAERRLLDRLGIDYEIMPSGCCGMAGGFGFEAEKYEVSMKIAEQAMLPRIRASSNDTLIVADGYSCREQIEQATGRGTIHIAELAAQSLRS